MNFLYSRNKEKKARETWTSWSKENVISMLGEGRKGDKRYSFISQDKEFVFYDKYY